MPRTTTGIWYPDTFGAGRDDIQTMMTDIDASIGLLADLANEMCSRDGVSVYNSGTITVPAGTTTYNHSFDTEVYDTDAFFGTAPAEPITLDWGVWLIVASSRIFCTGSTMNYASIQITSSASNRIGGRQVGPGLTYAELSAAAIHYVASGTTQEIRIVSGVLSASAAAVSMTESRMTAARIGLPWSEPRP